MGTEGVARVAGVCHDLALAEAKLIGAKLQRHGKGLLGVLFLTNQLGNLGQEAVEMAMHGGIAIVVSEVQRIAIATGSDRHLGDVAIGNGKQRLAHHALADKVARYGKPLIGRSGYSKIGAVGPANAASVLANLRKRFPNMFLLLDGGDLPNAFSNSCAAAFDEFGHGAIINIGDSVLGAWYTEELDPRDYVMGARHQVELFCKKMKNHFSIL